MKTIGTLGKLRRILSRREQLQIAALTAASIFGALLEIFGIGLLLPFFEILRNPARLLENPRFGPWLQRLDVSTEREIILLVGSLFLAIFFVRGLYSAGMLKIVFDFVFSRSVALSRRLLEVYLKANFSFHLNRNTSELIRNATVEVNNLMSGVTMSLMFVVSESIVALGLAGVLFLANPVMALVGLLMLTAMGGIFTAVLRKRILRIGAIRAEKQAKMFQWVNQSLGGVKEIKILGKEAFFVDSFTTVGTDYADAQRQSMLLSQIPRLIVETGLVLGLVGLVLVLVLAGKDLVELVPLLALFGAASVRFIPSFTRLVSSINSVLYYSASIDIVYRDLTDIPRFKEAPETSGPPITFREELRTEGLTHSYAGSSAPALRNADLSFPKGLSIALVGPSGAGKTTLANLILGLLRPTSGRILVDGADIRKNLPSWQRQIGYIPQDSFLLDDSLRRNVAFGLRDEAIDDRKVWRAVELAQLTEFVKSLGEGIDSNVGERGARISGGQRQRIGIARALYHDPPILVLDEATSALDQETEREFQAAIFGLAETKTIIIIAHRLSTVRHCDRIYVLDAGEVTGMGTYDELIACNQVFQQLVGGRRAAAVQDIDRDGI